MEKAFIDFWLDQADAKLRLNCEKDFKDNSSDSDVMVVEAEGC